MIKIHNTPEDGINMLILIVVGYLVWLAISTFSKGPGGAYGDDGDEGGGVGLPDPPLFQQLIGCNPMAWFIVIVAMLGFLCWYPSTLK